MIAPCYRLSNYISRNKELDFDQGHTANKGKSSLKARSFYSKSSAVSITSN